MYSKTDENDVHPRSEAGNTGSRDPNHRLTPEAGEVVAETAMEGHLWNAGRIIEAKNAGRIIGVKNAGRIIGVKTVDRILGAKNNTIGALITEKEVRNIDIQCLSAINPFNTKVTSIKLSHSLF